MPDATPAPVAHTPGGFTVVSKEDFFAYIAADGVRDPMPHNDSPHFTSWETKSRIVVGRTEPGYRDAGLRPKVYMLTDDARAILSRAGKLKGADQ